MALSLAMLLSNAFYMCAKTVCPHECVCVCAGAGLPKPDAAAACDAAE